MGSFPVPPGEQFAATYVQAGAALSWELDFWGRLRRLTEAARAQYLATEEGRRGALVSLVSQVMTTYFQLLEQDLELEISRETRDVANDNLRLIELRHDRGAATGLDVSQAQQLLYTATSAMAAAERGVGQTEDALSLLLGGAPAAQPRGKPLDQFPLPPQLPAGLPSALLERRPDILQAEQNLVAANAQIGAARAQYFPHHRLTGFLGGAEPRAVAVLHRPRAHGLHRPIRAAAHLPRRPDPQAGAPHRGPAARNAGRLPEGHLQRAARRFRRPDRPRPHARAARTAGATGSRPSESVRLSTLRYQGGLDSYLQVLDAQRSLFQGQLQLSQLRMLELQSVAQLYRALGGGWQ